jgi:uncharacterized radical SAM protein YgiQ
MPFLPLKKQEWNSDFPPDYIMVSADAYVDHPSFGHALIARLIESLGFSVAIIAQPVTDEDYKEFGEPKYAFLVSGGVVDSMVNNYTAAKKRRRTDEYSVGGVAGRRPDRAVTVYTKALKRLYPETAVIIGGIEASLRRLAHYDYWSDSVMPSILADCGADLLVYGMGEKPITEIVLAAQKGIPISKIKHIRGTAYTEAEENLSSKIKSCLKGENSDYIVTYSYKKVKEDKKAFAESFKIQTQNTDAVNGRGILQEQDGGRFVVVNPPQYPMTENECDRAFNLPYMRDYHPYYKQFGGVPAIEEVKFSIISHRGCFGSCSFCALNYHQGRVIQKRSDESILNEARELTKHKDFKGYIHDVGGPTANFRERACLLQKEHGVCKDKYCIGTKPCKNLIIDHKSYLNLLRRIRSIEGIKKVFIRSGIRFDYLMADGNGEFFKELVRYHISGQLKVAPEHISEKVLRLMNKSPHNVYLKFVQKFKEENERLKLKQYIVPYLISSHPGSTLNDAIELALYLKSIRYAPQQVQDFYPTPSTRSTCMYHTGIDPDTREKVYCAKTEKEKAMQRALLQFSAPKSRRLVAEALRLAGREDLIGYGKNCLIPPEKKKVYLAQSYKIRKQKSRE